MERLLIFVIAFLVAAWAAVDDQSILAMFVAVVFMDVTLVEIFVTLGIMAFTYYIYLLALVPAILITLIVMSLIIRL